MQVTPLAKPLTCTICHKRINLKTSTSIYFTSKPKRVCIACAERARDEFEGFKGLMLELLRE